MTEKSMRRLTADEHSVALLNLAVPSPIFRETEPIANSCFSLVREYLGVYKYHIHTLLCSLSLQDCLCFCFYFTCLYLWCFFQVVVQGGHLL